MFKMLGVTLTKMSFRSGGTDSSECVMVKWEVPSAGCRLGSSGEMEATWLVTGPPSAFCCEWPGLWELPELCRWFSWDCILGSTSLLVYCLRAGALCSLLSVPEIHEFTHSFFHSSILAYYSRFLSHGFSMWPLTISIFGHARNTLGNFKA